ncbi:MAG TPA: hypothetical protein VGJ86_09915, partial [Acidimicrobiales bacterium]
MKLVVITAVVVAALASMAPADAAPTAPAAPSAPCQSARRCAGVTPIPAGFMGRVRDDVNELNNTNSAAVHCEFKAPDVDGQPVLNPDGTQLMVQGTVRWRLTAIEQEWWKRWGDVTTGVMYRRECWPTDEFAQYRTGEFGELWNCG